MMTEFLVIALITAIKAIFSAADTAFTYLNKAEINQLSKKDKKAEKIKDLMENSNKFFGVIEVGTNMAELVASAYASITIVNTLTLRFEQMKIPYNGAIFLATLIITVVLAYILLIFGGILPKRIARNKPKDVAFALIDVVWILAKLNHPFERIIAFSTKYLCKWFKIPTSKQEKLTEKQLKMIITEGREEGVIASIQKKILFNTLKLEDITVKKTMKPKDKVDFIDINQSFEEVLENIATFRYTRIPVYEGNINNIIGVLNIKDLVMEYAKNKTIVKDIRPILRIPKFVMPDEKIFDAFKKLQKEKKVLAIVKNIDNEVVGLISLEDILEKIVGKISDEYDEN